MNPTNIDITKPWKLTYSDGFSNHTVPITWEKEDQKIVTVVQRNIGTLKIELDLISQEGTYTISQGNRTNHIEFEIEEEGHKIEATPDGFRSYVIWTFEQES